MRDFIVNVGRTGKDEQVTNELSTEALKQLAIDAMEDLKAQDIWVQDVSGSTTITDVMIIASGTSDRHVKSIAGNVVEQAKAAGHPPLGVEGEGGEWMLVDLGDVIVHVMQPQTRAFYNLEKLWSMMEESVSATRES